MTGSHKIYTILLRVFILILLSSVTGTLAAQQITIGTYLFPDKSEYQGEMFRGKPYGKGTTIFQNGDRYTGEYVKGKRQGKGVYQFSDGEKYDGEWFQDQQHGRGVYYFKNNNK